jgi:transcriptional regulator with XRE-family HTH domain
LRQRNQWTLQDVVIKTAINKAYLSEFENGKRELPEPLLLRLRQVLDPVVPPGSAVPQLERDDEGHFHLVFRLSNGTRVGRPQDADLRWTDSHGEVHVLFVGDR